MQLAIDRPLARRLGQLAIPVVIAMVSQTLINWVDHILIGRLPSSESIPGQAALGPALNLFWAVGGTLAAHLRRHAGADRAPPRRAGPRAAPARCCSTRSSSPPSPPRWRRCCGWFAAPHDVPPHPSRARRAAPRHARTCKWRMAGVFAMVVTMSATRAGSTASAARACYMGVGDHDEPDQLLPQLGCSSSASGASRASAWTARASRRWSSSYIGLG